MPKVDLNSKASVAASKKRNTQLLGRLKRRSNQLRAVIARRNRELAALKRKAHKSQRATACEFMLHRVGRHEDAGRPNRAAWLDRWMLMVGKWMLGSPWCGLTVWEALRAAGIHASTETMSTVAIRRMAQQGVGGFRRWKPVSQVQPGDVLIYGTLASGPVHTGMYVGGGRVVEGNTSPSGGGSQNNGGGIYIKTLAERRGWILGVAEPAYTD